MTAPAAADLSRHARPCSDCGARILWPRTRLEDWMPVDADPVASGNVIVHVRHGKLTCEVIARPATRAAMAAQGWPFYQHHRLSCPKADQWARAAANRARPTTAAVVSTAPPEGLF